MSVIRLGVHESVSLFTQTVAMLAGQPSGTGRPESILVNAGQMYGNSGKMGNKPIVVEL